MVPVESGKFCFHSSPDVSLDFILGNIGTLGKTKRTVSLGTIHKCISHVVPGFEGNHCFK